MRILVLAFLAIVNVSMAEYITKPGGVTGQTLTSGQIIVGNASNISAAVTMSGDVTNDNAGATTIGKIQTKTVSGTTGTSNVAFSDSPTFTTKITTPVLVSGSANPATAGVIQLGNQDQVAWGVPGGSTNMTVGPDAGNNGIRFNKGGLFTTNDATYNYPTIGVGAINGGTTGVNVALSVLTSTRQTGFYASLSGNSGATGSINGFLSAPNTTAEAFSAGVVASFNAWDIGKGATSTITRAIKYYAEDGDPTQGTNNAIFADNDAFVGNFAMHLASTNAVHFSGALQLPGLASSSAATTGTLCWTTVTGNVNVDTTVACLASTRKVKQDIDPLDIGLDTVMQLRPVSYQRKKEFNPQHNGREVGLIAEEVAEVDKRLVASDDKGDVYGVRYMQLTAVLVKAIQEQQAEISELKDRINYLEAE